MSDEYSKGISRMLEIFKVFYLSGSQRDLKMLILIVFVTKSSLIQESIVDFVWNPRRINASFQLVHSYCYPRLKLLLLLLLLLRGYYYFLIQQLDSCHQPNQIQGWFRRFMAVSKYCCLKELMKKEPIQLVWKISLHCQWRCYSLTDNRAFFQLLVLLCLREFYLVLSCEHLLQCQGFHFH